MFTLLLFNFALNSSAKTCLQISIPFSFELLKQFELNISLHSLINILSRRSRLLSGKMNPWMELPRASKEYITEKAYRSYRSILLLSQPGILGFM